MITESLSEEEWAEIQKDPYLLHLFDHDRVVAYVSALRTELARLKPSGQVAAEQVEAWAQTVRRAVRWATTDEGMAVIKAVDGLAAKAHGYEAAVREREELAEQVQAWGARWNAEEARAVQAEQERDAAVAGHAQLREALESQQAESHTLRRAFLHERHRADAAGAPPEHAYNAEWAKNLLADERKALTRARNEGLEMAAKTQDKEASDLRRIAANQPTKDAQNAYEAEALRASERAARIRAMKEPGL